METIPKGRIRHENAQNWMLAVVQQWFGGITGLKMNKEIKEKV